MRNIAVCYSEHAVKVSDSYCSGPLTKSSLSYVSPKSTPCIQNVVTCTYKAKISNTRCLFITISWCHKLICQGFFIKISEKRSTPSNSRHGFHRFPNMNGHKSFYVHDSGEKSKVVVHWDISSAIFDETCPMPIGRFYILVVVDAQVGFVVGEDCHAVEEVVPGLERQTLALVAQCEHFTGQWSNQICSKARFCDQGSEHEIMIKCYPEDDGPRNPVLSVYIDKKRVVKVKKLQWNFRGNQVIFVDGLLVDVMWDVYGWYYDQTLGGSSNVGISRDSKAGGCGLFMFRTRSGLDSRLWLEEEEKKLADKNHHQPEFSLLICASSKNPD